MELWGLTPEQARRQQSRQKRILKWLGPAGLIVLILQSLAAVRVWPTGGGSAQPDATPPILIPLDPVTTPEWDRHIGAWPTDESPISKARQTPTLPLPTPLSTYASIMSPDDRGQAGSPDPELPLRHPPTAPLSSDIPPDPSRTLTLEPFPGPLSEQTATLSGRGPIGATAIVWHRRSKLGQAAIDAQGRWQITLPTTPLDRGENELWLGIEQPGQRPQPVLLWTVRWEPWWLDAPVRLQADLGQGYACAPTTLGMAMDYYHRQDPLWPAPPTTELVAELRKKGFVDGYGADAQMVCDLAIAYGYSHSFFFRDWSQAHLRQMLDAGHPVIANVRINLSTNSYGHAVLVIGLSPDGQRVMFLDPLQGMREAAWSDFERSWASFGPPSCHGVVVRP